jgi:hypothetical protein
VPVFERPTKRIGRPEAHVFVTLVGLETCPRLDIDKTFFVNIDLCE